MTALNPYISFHENAKDALSFYHSVFGGELTTSTFGEAHATENPADNDLVMHGQITAANGLILMASDTPSHMTWAPGAQISVSLSGGPEDKAELTGYWNGLEDGANVTVPLAEAPWGDTFGMLTDKFGIDWMVNIAATAA